MELSAEGFGAADYARVVDQGVDSAKAFLDGIRGVGDEYLVRDVKLDGGERALWVVGAEFRQGRFAFGEGAAADDDVVI